MKSDMKIGILVGVVIVVILLVFFVNRSYNRTDKPIVPLPPPVQIDKPQAAEPAEPITAQPEPEQPKPQVILPARTEPLELQPPPPPPIEPQPEPIRQPRYHTVIKGDTLSSISETYYGHGKFWTEIQKANHQRIRNPNHLQPGWKLRIPYPDEIDATP